MLIKLYLYWQWSHDEFNSIIILQTVHKDPKQSFVFHLKMKIIKLHKQIIYLALKKNREKLNDIGFGNDFYDKTRNTLGKKIKIDNWTTSNLKMSMHQKTHQ